MLPLLSLLPLLLLHRCYHKAMLPLLPPLLLGNLLLLVSRLLLLQLLSLVGVLLSTCSHLLESLLLWLFLLLRWFAPPLNAAASPSPAPAAEHTSLVDAFLALHAPAGVVGPRGHRAAVAQ